MERVKDTSIFCSRSYDIKETHLKIKKISKKDIRETLNPSYPHYYQLNTTKKRKV